VNDTWSTPQSLFDKLDAEFHFTFDLCAVPHNAKCSEFFTPARDALKQPWPFGVLWLNPPYGRGIEKWMERACLHAAAATIVCLVPTRTNAPWWHDYVMKANEIRFIRKKVSFVGNKKGVAFTGHAVVVFRTPRRTSPFVSSYSQSGDALPVAPLATISEVHGDIEV
jgi:site-specific DNA-methyltransferase (adenine-specific)